MKIKNLFSGYITRMVFLAMMLFAFSACTKEVKSETSSPPDKLSFITKPMLVKVAAPDMLQLPFDLSKDKIKTYRFNGAGDSVVTFTVAPNTDIYIELSDSSNSSADTFKVYLRTTNVPPVTSGSDVLAYLIKENVIDTGAQTYTQGLIIPGDGTTVFYKVVYPYPSILKVVRSSYYNTRKGDKVIIKALTTPTGSIDVPDLNNLAAVESPGHSPDIVISNSETQVILQAFKESSVNGKRFKYPLKL